MQSSGGHSETPALRLSVHCLIPDTVKVSGCTGLTHSVVTAAVLGALKAPVLSNKSYDAASACSVVEPVSVHR